MGIWEDLVVLEGEVTEGVGFVGGVVALVLGFGVEGEVLSGHCCGWV